MTDHTSTSESAEEPEEDWLTAPTPQDHTPSRPRRRADYQEIQMPCEGCQ